MAMYYNVRNKQGRFTSQLAPDPYADQEPGLRDYLRKQLFEQRQQAVAIRREIRTGKRSNPTQARYNKTRDKWLSRFAVTPKDQRTVAQWDRFWKYYKQIYGDDEEDRGDYD